MTLFASVVHRAMSWVFRPGRLDRVTRRGSDDAAWQVGHRYWILVEHPRVGGAYV